MQGHHTDFTSEFYLEMGPLIIQSFLIVAIYPFIDLGILYFLLYLKRANDGGW